ncbi:MAG: hypothetical protein AAF750_14090 [Planctomycetota bacterium]
MTTAALTTSTTPTITDAAPQTQTPDPTPAKVTRPREAWIVPIGGLILAAIIGSAISSTSQNEDGVTSDIVAYIAPLILLMFIGYGIYKTGQCFIGGRHPIHGVLGVMVAGAGVAWAGFFVGSLLGLF